MVTILLSGVGLVRETIVITPPHEELGLISAHSERRNRQIADGIPPKVVGAQLLRIDQRSALSAITDIGIDPFIIRPVAEPIINFFVYRKIHGLAGRVAVELTDIKRRYVIIPIMIRRLRSAQNAHRRRTIRAVISRHCPRRGAVAKPVVKLRADAPVIAWTAIIKSADRQFDDLIPPKTFCRQAHVLNDSGIVIHADSARRRAAARCLIVFRSVAKLRCLSAVSSPRLLAGNLLPAQLLPLRGCGNAHQQNHRHHCAHNQSRHRNTPPDERAARRCCARQYQLAGPTAPVGQLSQNFQWNVV